MRAGSPALLKEERDPLHGIVICARLLRAVASPRRLRADHCPKRVLPQQETTAPQRSRATVPARSGHATELLTLDPVPRRVFHSPAVADLQESSSQHANLKCLGHGQSLRHTRCAQSPAATLLPQTNTQSGPPIGHCEGNWLGRWKARSRVAHRRSMSRHIYAPLVG